ncbi:N-formylglutamate amidohydrolase [Sphingomonas quercus]|uniref:N-formylglutamate amidohydrolase n=1 Tax=Sphingomonas quercus TaxID=2842451 RepID=UPI003F4DF6AF
MIPRHDDGLPHRIPGDIATGLLLIADHASNHVPPDIDLGVAPSLLDEHVAIDIGVAPLARALCAALGCPALLASVSRLVVDLNRIEDAPGLVPAISDGYAIPGNAALDAAGRAARVARFWRPWHAAIAETIAAAPPALILSLHSFTPRLAADPRIERPWQVGVLYNQDERAARLAIPALIAAGVVTGDNEPYSGRVLNYTMDRHAEANGIPYLGLEVRQDLIADPGGVARWCNIIAPIAASVIQNLREGRVKG